MVDRDRAAVLGDLGDLFRPGGVELDAEATVDFQEQSLHRVRVRAQMPCAAFLVFGDAYFPGWQLSLDGEASTLYRAHDALRTAFVPAGEHEVEFVYRPTSVYLGGGLTGLGLLGCVVLVVEVRRRRGSRSPEG